MPNHLNGVYIEYKNKLIYICHPEIITIYYLKTKNHYRSPRFDASTSLRLSRRCWSASAAELRIQSGQIAQLQCRHQVAATQ